MKMKFKSTGGLNVKNGRLISDRPIDKTGIAQAAEIKKMMKYDRKTTMIADGIMKAEMREQMMGTKDAD